MGQWWIPSFEGREHVRVRCPKCGSMNVELLGGWIRSSVWHKCEDCGYKSKAVNPEWAETFSEEVFREIFNPTKGVGF